MNKAAIDLFKLLADQYSAKDDLHEKINKYYQFLMYINQSHADGEIDAGEKKFLSDVLEFLYDEITPEFY